MKENYNKLPNEELYKLFPSKTPTAIYKKAYKLGLRKEREIEFLNRSEARKGDNRIENLCLMTHSAHTIFHHSGARRSDKTRKNISESKRLKHE